MAAANGKLIGADHQAHSGQTASVVRAGPGYRAEQGSDYVPGISAETVGAEALWLGFVTLPPGRRTKAHVHARHETAFYHMSGAEIELWSGDELEHKKSFTRAITCLSPPTSCTSPSIVARSRPCSSAHAMSRPHRRAS